MAMKKINKKKKAVNGTKVANPELLEFNPDAQSSITQSMNYNPNLAQQIQGTNQINPVDRANQEAILIDPHQANEPVSPDTIGPAEVAQKQRRQFSNPFEGIGIPTGELIAGGVNFLNALIPASSAADSRQYTPNVYNRNAFGTGSTAIYADGGEISDDEKKAWNSFQESLASKKTAGSAKLNRGANRSAAMLDEWNKANPNAAIKSERLKDIQGALGLKQDGWIGSKTSQARFDFQRQKESIQPISPTNPNPIPVNVEQPTFQPVAMPRQRETMEPINPIAPGPIATNRPTPPTPQPYVDPTPYQTMEPIATTGVQPLPVNMTAPKPKRVAVPKITGKQTPPAAPTKRIRYEKLHDDMGREEYSPIFEGYDYGEAMNAFKTGAVGTEFGGIPVTQSPDLWRERWANIAPGTKSDQWTKSTYDDGGPIMGDSGIQLDEEGSLRPISANAYSNPIMQFSGPSHDAGGIGMQFGGNKVEVEGDETAYKDVQGNLQIFGNMKVPGTNKKFKSLSKDIAKKEVAATKMGAKATTLIDEANPFDAYSALKFNTGRVLADGAAQKQKRLTEEKETLATIQNLMLEVSDKFNTTPDKISDIMKDGGEIPKFKDGGKLDIDEVNAWVAASAKKYGVDPATIQSLINTESGYNSGATSNKGALSLMQFMPSTAKEYGLSEADLKSSDPKIQQKVVDAGIKHFSGLLKKNGNDYKLALAAYNGGQGSVDFVKKELGKKKITGDEWMGFMQNRRKTNPNDDPSLWQNQTLDYVDRIAGSKKTPAEQEWFRNYYYNGNTHAKTTMDPLQVINRPLPVETNPDIPTFNLPGTEQPTTPEDKSSPLKAKKGKAPRSLADRNRLGLTDFMSELAYLADRPDDVPFRRVEPVLHTPYQVSFQDRLNENQASFNSIQRQLPNNPEALSVLAGQKYSADNAVLADQFRTNQGISNDVINKNVGILNQNAQMNFQIGDQHDVRQAQAQSNTDAHKYQALANISDKFNKNQSENMNIRLAESMSQFRLNNENQMEFTGGPHQFNVGTGSPFQNNPNNKVVTKKDANGNVVSVTETDQPDIKEWQDFEKFKKMRNAANVTTTRKWGGLI